MSDPIHPASGDLEWLRDLLKTYPTIRLHAALTKLACRSPANPPATAAGVGEAYAWASEWQGHFATTGRTLHYDEQEAHDNAKWMAGRAFPLFTTPASHDALIARVRAGLQKIADGREVRLPDGTTVMVEIDDPEAMARALLNDLDARDGG